MTVINNSVKAKIEIDGLKQYIKAVPAVITVNSVAGEPISGLNSGATATLQRDANIGDSYIYINNVVGDFDYSEPIYSFAQIGETNGSTTYFEDDYINASLGVALRSSVDMSTNFDPIPAESVAVGQTSGAVIRILEDLEAFYFGSFEFEYLTNTAVVSSGTESFIVNGSGENFDVLGPADDAVSLWTIESTGDLGVKIDDAVKRIDIDDGGNFATGYTFGFTLRNFILVSSLINDGVFVQNLPVRYYIDFDDGNGYTQIWTGILDTFPTAGSVTAVFTCIDSMKARNTNFGSSTVPIALNQNFNCKLVSPEDGEVENVIKYESETTGNKVDYYYCVGANKDFSGDGSSNTYPANVENIDESIQSLLFRVKDGTDWVTAFNSGEALSLRVVAGSQSGSTYNIKSIQNRGYYASGGYDFYLVTIDSDTGGILGEFTSSYSEPLSVLKLVNYENTYNLSENEVLDVHDTNTIDKETLRSTTDDVQSYLSTPKNYTTDKKQVFVTGINDNGQISAQEDITIDSSGYTVLDEDYSDNSPALPPLSIMNVKIQIPLLDLYKVSGKSDSIYFDIEDITFTTTFDVNGYADYWKDAIVSSYGILRNDIAPIVSNRIEFINEAVKTATVKTGNQLKVSFLIPDRSIEFDGFGDKEVYSSAFLEFIMPLSVRDSLISGEPVITDVEFNGMKYTIPRDIKADVMSVGCYGENVQSGNKFENYPDTIKYIETTYGDIDLSEIDTLSYTQAQEDYNFLPSFTHRNPAHQIIEQTDVNSVLKDMLYYSHLGYFIDRLGRRTLSNWLTKSTVFSDTLPSSTYTTLDCINIGNMKRPRIKKIASDYQVDYDFNESTGDYQRPMRIKNTDKPSFDFLRDTEGVSLKYYQVAKQAWELLSAGEKRLKKQSQTVDKSKWIKDLYTVSVLGGESEAINFIRNQAGHVNREHEKITITLPLNATDAIKELLSFDGINGDKLTDFEQRNGWIVEHRISWTSKQIVFTYMLDISLKDPFLVQIGIIQDNPTVDDIIEDDETETNIIQDGAGK